MSSKNKKSIKLAQDIEDDVTSDDKEAREFTPSLDIRISSFIVDLLKAAGLKNLAKKVPFSYKKFWKQKYSHHGFDIMYCGNLGRTKKQNLERRMKKINILFNFMKKFGVNKSHSVLDVGCGVGIFTNYFFEKKFKNYKGIDLTKELIINLKNKYPNYDFEQKDIGKEDIGGSYDAIIMMSVTQHIIDDRYFKFAMKSVQNALKPNGLFFVTDIADADRRDSVYTIRRPLEYYKKILNRLQFLDMTDFEGLQLFCFKKVG